MTKKCACDECNISDMEKSNKFIEKYNKDMQRFATKFEKQPSALLLRKLYEYLDPIAPYPFWKLGGDAPGVTAFLTEAISERMMYTLFAPTLIKKEKFDKLLKSYPKILNNVLNLKDYSGGCNHVLACYADIIVEEKEKRIQPQIEMRNFDGADLPVLISDGENPFYINGTPSNSILSLYQILSTVKYTTEISKRFVNKAKNLVKEYNIDKIAFVGSGYGEQGHMCFMGTLGKELDLGFIRFRPKAPDDASKVRGSKTKDGEKICLIYDAAITGGTLKRATEFFRGKRRNIMYEDNDPKKAMYDLREKLEVPCALAIINYNAGADKMLNKMGVHLESVIDTNLE